MVFADFRFANLTDDPFAVRKVELFLEDGAGQTLEGMGVSGVDGTV